MEYNMSYSRVEMYTNCPYRYFLNYVEGLKTFISSKYLDMGTLAHDSLEYKFVNKDNYNFAEHKQNILCEFKKIKNKYMFDDEYDNKMKLFLNKLKNEDFSNTLFAEKEFYYDLEGFTFYGKIDRIDKIGDVYKVYDYKTSKKIFTKDKIATPLQMVLYSMVTEKAIGQQPECVYDFVFLNELQPVISRGWYKRGQRTLKERLNQIKEGNFSPKITPLCEYCDYRKGSGDAWFDGACKFYKGEWE